jgi:hypothetical protein
MCPQARTRKAASQPRDKGGQVRGAKEGRPGWSRHAERCCEEALVVASPELVEQMTDDERDRLTRLEVQFSHLSKAMDDTHEKVTVMHDLLMQAKGMKYLIMMMAAVGGGISALAVKYLPFMRG